MSDRNRDVRVRILSEYYDEGSKAAERATRRLAAMQMSATQEDIAREAKRAAAVVEANRRQAEAMESFGRRSLQVSAAIAIGLGLSAKAAMDWESAWAGVTKTVDGSPEQMAALESQLRGLALILPATHEEIAGVAEAAGQLGVKRKDIADFTRTMIDLGETTNLSADEAATSIAQFSNIMGIGADKADRLGASIVALGNDGASTERDILSMGLRIAGAGRTVGMTADEVLALASTLSSVGIEAEAGGSAISRVMLQIDKDLAMGGDAVEKYAKVAGVSAADFAQKWETDAAGALDLFTTGLGKMQSQGQNTTQILDDLGFSEIRVSDALRRLALSGDLNTRSLETSSRAWEENNALAEEAAKRYETTEARLQIARNQINDAAIDIGGNFLPALADATEAVGSLAVGFGALPPQAQSWVAGLGAAAAGLGTVVGGAAIAIPKLMELKTTIDNLNGGSSAMGKALGSTASFLTGPWGLALGAATLVGAAWLKSQGEIKQNVDALTRSLDEQTGAITDNTRAQTVQRLQERGVLQAASDLGLELDRVTDAALGNSTAMRYVALAIEEQRKAEQAAAADTSLYTAELANRSNAVDLLSRQLPGQRMELEASRDEWQLQAEALGDAAGASDTAADATAGLTAELSQQEQLAQDAADALDELAQMLDDLNGPTLNARDAERAWHEQLREVTASLEENGRSLDITTAAGSANQAVLDGLARSGMDRARALLEETGSVEKFNASLEESRQALFNNARQFYDTDEAAWAYVDSVLAIPDTATTTAILETNTAEQKALALRDRLRSILSSNNFVITPDIRATNPFYANRADGGWAGPAAPTRAAANGLDRVSMIAPGGANILWAEPETGWEAYISGKPSMRERNIGILGDVAQRFGLVVTRADQIGPVGPAAAPSSASLAGLAIEGQLDLGNGLTGFLRGVVRSEISTAQAARTSAISQGSR